MKIIQFLLVLFVIWALYKLFRLWQKKQTRYIPEDVKKTVIARYFNMCAVCPDTVTELFEFHHKKKYSDGGDNSEKNIVPLCPKHHAMITRFDGEEK